ncbi:MAG: nodulation protein NfeD [Betaproteobacteria bacterium]|nr:nodulation protein NfeD [Betaproteobacteria bacterium]
MKHLLAILALLAAWGTDAAAPVAGADEVARSPRTQAARPAAVPVLMINGAIGPATADLVSRSLKRAAEARAPLFVLQMDTPGGLDTSMRAIIKDIIASPVPVAAFVAPGGARAASAGTYILYASHIAAMAPGTNLGAATPVAIGGMPGTPSGPPVPREGERERGKNAAEDGKPAARGAPGGAAPEPEAIPGDAAAAPLDDMGRKRIHDAAAYIRGLAQLRGRNADWAERAVREAVSLTAEEAARQKVIDFVATDVDDLLRQAHGRKVRSAGGELTVDTAAAAPATWEPDWRTRLLSVITDPTVAYMLLLLGVYGLFFEFSNPGFVAPGVIGAIALLLALFAFQLLPVSYAGLALILLGLAFMVAEVFLPSFGALGIGGLVAFVAGSVMLIDTDAPGFGILLGLVASVALASALFVFFVVGMAVKARRRPVVSGAEDLLAAEGEMLDDCEVEGWARVRGENWRVRTGAPLRRGQRVSVVRRDGLVLEVRPLGGP